MKPRYARRCADVRDLNFNQEYHLLTGKPFMYLHGINTRTELAVAWRLHRERLLPEFIQKKPGRRPFAWWLLEHGKERPIVGVNSWENTISIARAEPCYLGFLHTCAVGWTKDGRVESLQEMESDYLRRHDLLEQWEIDWLDEHDGELAEDGFPRRDGEWIRKRNQR